MPFSTYNQKVSLPKPIGYPKELKFIGDHIRKWRMDNNLQQANIARILKVCEDTIVGWENRGRNPSMKQIPEIAQMIGYLPVQFDLSTFGGRIKYYRYLKGFTPEEFGILVSADSSTVRAWELNKNKPHKSRREYIEKIISKTTLSVI